MAMMSFPEESSGTAATPMGRSSGPLADLKQDAAVAFV
jgi:hypothetical protein